VWCHTWWKNWVNCTVLTGNYTGLWNFLSSSLSHRELRSSLRESHSFLSLPADNTLMSHAQEDTQNWHKNWQTWWETCTVPENIQFTFSCSFFYIVKVHNLTYCMGLLRDSVLVVWCKFVNIFKQPTASFSRTWVLPRKLVSARLHGTMSQKRVFLPRQLK